MVDYFRDHSCTEGQEKEGNNSRGDTCVMPVCLKSVFKKN
jgi:hypothetical protein